MCDDSGNIDTRKFRELLVLFYRIFTLFLGEYSEAYSAHSRIQAEKNSCRLCSLSHYLIAQSLYIVIVHDSRDQVILDDGVHALDRSKSEDDDVALDTVLTEVDGFFESSYSKAVHSIVLEHLSALRGSVSVAVCLDYADHFRALHLCLDLLYVVVESRHVDLGPYLS